MGRREEARAEAAFLRGDKGVDGRATAEDQRSPEEVERDKAKTELLRGRTFLGREFLTWLLWRSESGEPLIEHGGAQVTVSFSTRVVLRGLHGEVVELAAKGTMAPYSAQVRRALADGLLVHTARLRFHADERTWDASLDAEFLDVKSAKLPELLTEAEDDRISERLDLADQLSAMIDALVKSFLAVRATKGWAQKVVPAMKEWMTEDRRPAGSKLERARRVAG